jgi:hypothetical protein
MASLVLKLTGDDTYSLRGMPAADGMQVWSVYDFMTKACRYNSKETGACARNEFKRLIKDGSDVKDEIVSSCYYLKFPGSGQRETPCMTIRGLQRLLMILGGKVAAEFRVLVEGVFTRVMAGDKSLIEVINENAASDAPIQQIYRQALVQEPVGDDLSLVRKRRMEELEIERLEAEIEAKKLSNAAMARDSVREHITKVTSSYLELCQDTVMDERARLMLKDSFLNMAMVQQGQSGQALIANHQGVSPNKPISLSSIAAELGLNIPDDDFISIGKEVSKRYFKLHGKKPPKHDQLIKGKVTLVNSYTESDRPIVEEVLRWHAAGRN